MSKRNPELFSIHHPALHAAMIEKKLFRQTFIKFFFFSFLVKFYFFFKTRLRQETLRNQIMAKMRFSLILSINYARSELRSNYDSIVLDLDNPYILQNFTLSDASLEILKCVKSEASKREIENADSLKDDELLEIHQSSLQSLQHSNHLVNGLKLSVFQNDPVSSIFLIILNYNFEDYISLF